MSPRKRSIAAESLIDSEPPADWAPEYDSGVICYKEEDEARSARLKRVLNKLHRLQVKEDFKLPLLRVACRLFSDCGYGKRQANGMVQLYSIEPPEWLSRAAINALAGPWWERKLKGNQLQQKNKTRKLQDENDKQNKTTEHFLNCIKAYLRRNYVRHLQKQNNIKTKELRIYEFLAKDSANDRGAEYSDSMIKVLCEEGEQFKLDPIDEDDYFVFDVDTERLDKAFKQKFGLSKVIK